VGHPVYTGWDISRVRHKSVNTPLLHERLVVYIYVYTDVSPCTCVLKTLVFLKTSHQSCLLHTESYKESDWVALFVYYNLSTWPWIRQVHLLGTNIWHLQNIIFFLVHYWRTARVYTLIRNLRGTWLVQSGCTYGGTVRPKSFSLHLATADGKQPTLTTCTVPVIYLTTLCTAMCCTGIRLSYHTAWFELVNWVSWFI
jgi:hypothetical protein